LRQKEQLIDMIAGVQSHRMNEQRASAEFLPGNPTRVSGSDLGQYSQHFILFVT
jgi:hypothetical protein